jgi:hypothetical protein
LRRRAAEVGALPLLGLDLLGLGLRLLRLRLDLAGLRLRLRLRRGPAELLLLLRRRALAASGRLASLRLDDPWLFLALRRCPFGRTPAGCPTVGRTFLGLLLRLLLGLLALATLTALIVLFVSLSPLGLDLWHVRATGKADPACSSCQGHRHCQRQ